MEQRGTVAAVVAAAGLSSRMGAFKPLLPFDGTVVIRRCVNNLLQAGAAEIVVVTGYRGDEIAAALSDCPVRLLRNPGYADSQMFDSICLGLKALTDRCEKILITPGDVPWVSSALIRSMLTLDADFVCPRLNGQRGHPVVLTADKLPALLAWQGDGGLRGAVEALGLTTAFADTSEVGITIDLDTPEDYCHLLKLHP